MYADFNYHGCLFSLTLFFNSMFSYRCNFVTTGLRSILIFKCQLLSNCLQLMQLIKVARKGFSGSTSQV